MHNQVMLKRKQFSVERMTTHYSSTLLKIVFFTITISGILFFIRNHNALDKSQTNKSVVNTSTQTISPPNKVINEWEIIYNEVFSIQYPPTYIPFNITTSSMNFADKSEYLKDEEFFETGWSRPKISMINISVWNTEDTILGLNNDFAKNVTKDDFYNQKSHFWRNLPTGSGNGGMRKFSFELTTIGEYEAIKVITIARQGVESDDEDIYSYYIYAPLLENKVVAITYELDPHTPSFQQYVPTLEKIISTFRLTK